MAPKHSSSSSATDESSDDEVTAPSPPPKTTTAPKKANGSSTAPKPSSTSTQVPKPKPSSAAASAASAQGLKSKSSSSTYAAAAAAHGSKPTSSSEDDGSDSDSGEDEDDKKEVKADNEEEESSVGNDSDSGEAKDDNEEEEEESSDSSDSESGENRINPPPQQQPQQPPLKPTTTEASADGSTDDSGSESSDHPPHSPRRSSRVADPSIKPIATKPMDVTSKPTSIPASNQDSKAPNKKKHKVPEALENQSGGLKRQLFQRIWSEEDEISILHGMADYHAKKGTVPSSTDMDVFYDFIQKSLQMEVSKTQLTDKVRRLKKKYDTAAARGKNGVDPSFTKPHERTAYDLSKKIWGPKRVLSKDAEIDDNITRKRQKIKEQHSMPTSDAMITNEDDDSVNVKSLYPLLRKAVLQMTNEQSSSPVAKRALELVDEAKAMALETKYHKLKLSEMKQYMHRTDLTKEIVKMTMSAIEKLG